MHDHYLKDFFPNSVFILGFYKTVLDELMSREMFVNIYILKTHCSYIAQFNIISNF